MVVAKAIHVNANRVGEPGSFGAPSLSGHIHNWKAVMLLPATPPGTKVSRTIAEPQLERLRVLSDHTNTTGVGIRLFPGEKQVVVSRERRVNMGRVPSKVCSAGGSANKSSKQITHGTERISCCEAESVEVNSMLGV